MTDTKQRIAKIIAAAGLCSRRDAERWIGEGRVEVNGETLTTPATLVSNDDIIKVDGKKINTVAADAPRMWIYHKPEGLVVSHKDEQDRPTVFENLPKHLPRVVSVGRLDLNSEGLLLLTTSGALARALELPSNKFARIYRVRVRGTPTARNIRLLEAGITIDGVDYKPIQIEMEPAKERSRNQWLNVTLHEGKNREIRRLFEHFDLPVSRLIRIQYGDFHLDDLPAGDVEEIKPDYVVQLMKSMGVTA